MGLAPRVPDNAGKKTAANSRRGDLRELGPYRILRLIAVGGMSEVYLAYDPKHRRQVAIKVLAEHLAPNMTFLNRFLREGKLSQELSHPAIVDGADYGRDTASGKYFIVMEFVDGPTAQDRLEKQGRFPVAEATRVILDIARALDYLHGEHFIHRDIKPGNILLAPDGSARLADLGVAKHLENSSSLTTLDQGVGTPYYMPWEQSLNACLVDPRSDIFALGATFYHLLTGHVPFPGDDENEIAQKKNRGVYVPATERRRSLPPFIDNILDRMLARDPRKRFSTAQEVVEVMTASGLADGRPVDDSDLHILEPQPLAPTRADLKSHVEVDTPLAPEQETVWLVKYQRDDGGWRQVRGRTRELIMLFEEGALPDEAIAARETSKVFRRLKAYPEFRLVERKVVKRENPLRRPRGSAISGFARGILGSLVLTSSVILLLGISVAAIMRLLACQP